MNEERLTKEWSEKLENNFTYHSLKEGQPELYKFLRNEAKKFAYNLVVHCPDSRERSLALTKLEEVVFWANASIARDNGDRHESSK